jgi:CTP synthase (UTP-ammonia lyase)
LQWVEATQLEKFDENGNDKTESEQYVEAWNKVKQANGVIVPGGFGNR